jgi:membrane fusion protein, multidrug efflux system
MMLSPSCCLSRSARARIVAVVSLALLLAACGESKPGAGANGGAPPEVGVFTIKPQATTVTTDLPGRTSAYRIAQVRARVDGVVIKRAFKEGSDVKAGQLLFQIDPAPFKAALASAQATLMKAQANLASVTAQAERYKVLVESNAVSKQDYDNAVASEGQAAADVAAGRAAVQTASINLGYTDVTAPISGRIGPALVTEGGYVQASAATLLANIQQITPIYVDLNQTSVEGLRLRREVASGQLQLNGPNQAKIRLALEDGSQYPLTGSLQFTDITVDQGTGSVIVRAIFPNPDYVLLPGMFVRALLDEGVNDKTLLVPEVAVTHNPKGEAIALVVGSDNKVAAATLVTGRTVGSSWVVESGIKANDRVIVEGGQKVQPGQVVKPVESAAPQGHSVSAAIVVDPTNSKSSAPDAKAPAGAH